MNNPIYLDYAAATPLDPEALKVMQPFLTEQFYNPSALYQPARQVRKSLESARLTVARVLGAKPTEVIFTAGATEANNLAIQGVMSAHPESEVLTLAIEHESILEPTNQFLNTILPVLTDGRVDLNLLKQSITDKTVLISVMYANNEIGVIQSLKEISKLITQIRNQRHQAGNPLPLYLHTDAAQAANYLDINVSRLGVDLMTLNGGKIYGPKQSGCLYIRASTILKPIIRGGGQELNIRSGSENVASIIGFATMLQKVQADRKSQSQRQQKLQQEFIATLLQKNPHIIINGSRKYRLPNNINFSAAGIDGERLVMELDNHGILVATGSACMANSDQPSHVLKALGLSDEATRGSLRITLGRQTTEAEIKQAVDVVNKLITDHLT